MTDLLVFATQDLVTILTIHDAPLEGDAFEYLCNYDIVDTIILNKEKEDANRDTL